MLLPKICCCMHCIRSWHSKGLLINVNIFSVYLLIASVGICVSIRTCRDMKSVLDLPRAIVIDNSEPPGVGSGI